MTGFLELVSGADPIPDGFALSIPPDWHQGRTAYGGFSSALALTAAMQVGGELPPLRSAQISMIAPLSGAVEARARVLRRGRNATWVSAEIAGEGGIGLTASFVFMSPIESTLQINDQPPPAALIAPEDARPFINPNAPQFLQHHFDVRFALPRGEEKRPELCWWVRVRQPATDGPPLDPMVELLLTADALPPGVMPLLKPGVPVSTMQWQVNLLTPAPKTDDWWLLRSASDYAEAGCSSQTMAIWNTRGEPMLTGMQSIALFG
jgi:acyl-CoA thioesterase